MEKVESKKVNRRKTAVVHFNYFLSEAHTEITINHYSIIIACFFEKSTQFY